MNLESLEFHHPWFLLAAIPALAIVYWAHRKHRPRPALVFPSVGTARVPADTELARHAYALSM